MKYTHKLTKETYTALRAIEGGVLFLVAGEHKEMTNHQVARLLIAA